MRYKGRLKEKDTLRKYATRTTYKNTLQRLSYQQRAMNPHYTAALPIPNPQTHSNEDATNPHSRAALRVISFHLE